MICFLNFSIKDYHCDAEHLTYDGLHDYENTLSLHQTTRVRHTHASTQTNINIDTFPMMDCPYTYLIYEGLQVYTPYL